MADGGFVAVWCAEHGWLTGVNELGQKKCDGLPHPLSEPHRQVPAPQLMTEADLARQARDRFSR